MLFISDGSESTYYENIDKVDFPKVLKKKFRVKDTPFSRRQINAIVNSNLIFKDKKAVRGWRNFSIREVIYLLLLRKLKDFSFESYQMLDLKDCFFKNLTKSNKGKYSNKINFEVAFALVFMQIQVFLIIENNFKAYFVDLATLPLLTEHCSSYFCLDFNKLVNEFLEKLGLEKFEPIIKSLRQFESEALEQVKKLDNIMPKNS